MGDVVVRLYEDGDREAVRDLFTRINAALAPPHLEGAFAAYVHRSLAQEINRIPAYYAERGGAFWVARRGVDDGTSHLVGMFGLERAEAASAELRRMYVEPAVRRRGIARLLLARAEVETLRLGCRRMTLSTSELQAEALALYRSSGFTAVREEVATGEGSNKTVGAGLRRFYFEKDLTAP